MVAGRGWTPGPLLSQLLTPLSFNDCSLFVCFFPLYFPRWHELPKKAKNASHLTQIRGWMSRGFITHWLKRVLWERMGSIIIVSLATSTHPAKKLVGLPLFRHRFTKGLPSSLQLFWVSLENSAHWPGKEVGRGRERRKGRVLPPCFCREKSLGGFGDVSLGSGVAAPERLGVGAGLLKSSSSNSLGSIPFYDSRTSKLFFGLRHTIYLELSIRSGGC